MTDKVTVPLVAAFLASAGIPLYIHLPSFAAELGLGLGTIGYLLFGLRALDFVQDPILGRVIDRFPAFRSRFAAGAFLGMGIGFWIVFVMQPNMFGLVAGLVFVFTSYSLGTILFYGQGAAVVGDRAESEHLRFAGLRETGALGGIVVAAILPGLLGGYYGVLEGYSLFGLGLAIASLAIWLLSRPFWRPVGAETHQGQSLRRLLQPKIIHLLLIALLNALPVAVTSTLFLFFVEDRLELPDLAGLFLLLFFLTAGMSALVWSRASARFGARQVLLFAMCLAVISFVGAFLLPAGAAWRFGLICAASGAALGADMVILPALFANVLMTQGVATGIGFGVWAFAAKMSLALAAAIVLPALQYTGFTPGGTNTAEALQSLNFLYAVLPCALKLLALAFVARLPRAAAEPSVKLQ
ncbi:MFS transporter [Aliishimia ponticola]|uniref:MFS transporter n=1 Tax=Aliishimia ponticola TaxID=2499833 RepID=A0A4V3XK10_9RHOB|nr:MFS transporter [Aliishimia ponticola]THH35123.1 MFS transporter [Aliishimia ponticola]